MENPLSTFSGIFECTHGERGVHATKAANTHFLQAHKSSNKRADGEVSDVIPFSKVFPGTKVCEISLRRSQPHQEPRRSWFSFRST